VAKIQNGSKNSVCFVRRQIKEPPISIAGYELRFMFVNTSRHLLNFNAHLSKNRIEVNPFFTFEKRREQTYLMKPAFILLISFNVLIHPLYAQSLESIFPVTSAYCKLPDSVSFVFASTDYNYFLNLPASFTSSLQIIDANEPWPPRWYLPSSFDSLLPFMALMPINGSVQQNKLSYYTVFRYHSPGLNQIARVAYILCNEQAEPVDTFFGNLEIDSHEFRLYPNGEKLYFDVAGEKLNGRDLLGLDTMMKIKYENIAISDSRDSVIFYWNTLSHLGLRSMYPVYRDIQRLIKTNNAFDFSHGNSLWFDYDGDILYSFKHIGIGKISRKDGHIIWRIDRSNLKPNLLSDTIPLFLQHDFKSVKDSSGNIIYTVLSNGDSLNPHCKVLEFTLHWTADSVPVFKLFKRIIAPENIRITIAGNFDLEQNGNYLLNYGVYRSDTAANHNFLEYRDSRDSLLAAYTVPSRCFYYRVHKTGNWGPHRPVVIEKTGTLMCITGESGTWYKLYGKGLKSVKLVGKGSEFQPPVSGYYCVAVKSGIGYVVSMPVKYSR
jgi:hypothetical protein